MRYEILGKRPTEGQWRWAEARSVVAIQNWKQLCSEIGESASQSAIDAWVADRERSAGAKIDLLRLSRSGKPEHYIRPSESRLASDLWADIKPNGNAQLRKIMGGKFFDTPKSMDLLRRIIEFSCTEHDIVLDFFAGSGTTGHSVLEMNKEEKAKLRFLLIQLNEPCKSDSQPPNQKFRTIADVTKERLRRAGAKIRDENPLFPGDLGFRVLKLDSSNIRAWDPNPHNLAQSLQTSIDHLISGRTEQDILFELLLKLGLDLTIPIEEKQFVGHTVHSIGAGVLLVCLSKHIKRTVIEPLALEMVEWHRALAPEGEVQVVFRDSAFEDDVAKTNLTAILQQHGLLNIRSL